MIDQKRFRLMNNNKRRSLNSVYKVKAIQEIPILKMKAKLVYLGETNTLQLIHQQLKSLSQFAENPHFDLFFQNITKQLNNSQPIFAICLHLTTNSLQLIYTLHTEYKLTRQLCKCLHIQQLYADKDLNHSQIQLFQKDLLPQLDCYKVVALGINENSLLKPNQKFMTLQSKPML